MTNAISLYRFKSLPIPPKVRKSCVGCVARNVKYIVKGCVPNKVGERHHDSESGKPCSVEGSETVEKKPKSEKKPTSKKPVAKKPTAGVKLPEVVPLLEREVVPVPTVSENPTKVSEPLPPPAEKKSAKGEIAKASTRVLTKEDQRYAEQFNEPRIAKVLSGKSLDDSEPIDVIVPGEADKVAHGIELKTMMFAGTNGRIFMNQYARIRKVMWERQEGASFHTIVSDDRAVYNALGPGKHDESKRVYYYRRGVAGSVTVEGMQRCESLEEVKDLMDMAENKLPPAAKRTDGDIRFGKWIPLKDERGFKNVNTGEIVRPKV